MQILYQLLSCCCDKGHNRSNLRMREFWLMVPRDESIVVGRHARQSAWDSRRGQSRKLGTPSFTASTEQRKQQRQQLQQNTSGITLFISKPASNNILSVARPHYLDFSKIPRLGGGISSKPPSILTFNIYSM